MAKDGEVGWLFELELDPARRQELEALLPAMVESTSQEPGARAYEVYINDEGTTVCVYERYESSDAALAHMSIFGEKFADQFLDLAKPLRFTVLGSPGEALADAIRPLGAAVHAAAGGFTR